MLFGRFYIKNYHTNYNSYFPLEVKGLTGKNICIHAETAFGAIVFLLSQNPITQCKFKTDEYRCVFLKSPYYSEHLYDIFTNHNDDIFLQKNWIYFNHCAYITYIC